MARIRSVHPGLFTDADWVECSAMARLLIIGLWTHSDDQGVFVWRSKEIKMALMPGDECDIQALMSELSDNGLIKQYEIGGKKYGAIKNFRRWQRPQKPNAIHPVTEDIRQYVGLCKPNSETDTPPVSDQYDTDTVNPIQMEDVGGRSIGIGGEVSARDDLGWPVSRGEWILAISAEADPDGVMREPLMLKRSELIDCWRNTDRFEWADVISGVKAGLASCTDPPSSWKYFAQPIARARRDRTTPTPEAQNERRNSPYQTAAERNQDSTVRAFQRVFGGASDEPNEPFDDDVSTGQTGAYR